jgi:hypothetical protein
LRERGRALGLFVAAGLSTGGCYRYVPAQLTTVPPREEVRVRVTESAATRLVKEFGTYTTQLQGQFAPEAHDSVSIAVAITRDYRGMALESTRQTLFLGRSEVVEVRRREFSRGRTALATVGALATLGVLVQTVVQLSDPNPGDEVPPPPPPAPYRGPARITILRW